MKKANSRKNRIDNKIYKLEKHNYFMKRGVLVSVVFLIVLINLASVLADGGYFPSPGYWIRPGQQKAIILYEDNTETMILTSGFIGNAKDFVWIIPTPKRPTITKANEEVFINMAILAQPQYDRGVNYGLMMEAATGKADFSAVAVIESKQVDYYDVSVLVARDSEDLIKWFNDNGYEYPEEYSYVLNHYIDKEWTFTAIKVSPESEHATEVIQDLEEGNPTPIKMVFESDKLVFPLKISSVDFKSENEQEDVYYSYKHGVPIQVYILADEKYQATNFNMLYGNWVKKNQIEDLAEDDNGNPLIQPKENKYFLTSLTANLQKSQMDDDVFFKKANDNKKVNAGPETYQLSLYGLLIGFLIFVTWIFTPLGIMFITGTFILFLSSNKSARTIGWILEFISLIITAVIAIIFFSIAGINGSLGNYVVISVLITSLIVVGLMFLLMILEIKYKKQERVK